MVFNFSFIELINHLGLCFPLIIILRNSMGTRIAACLPACLDELALLQAHQATDNELEAKKEFF